MGRIRKFEKIILIDDDKVNNYVNLQILKNFGLTDNIQTFLNGEDAIHFLEWNCIQEGKKCPDLILLDLNMPIMNGFEFLSIYDKLKFKKEHVQIVVLTSSQDDTDVKKVKSYGIEHYMNKPLVAETLRAFLDQVSGTSLSA